ncbi:hypothetical protein ACJMK2_015896 [Sinanodonta woodiana]|uniref:SLIT-ROBO Rho GTPase-activating protein 1-like n=1 Tax=Sinanodonta woodiana TaxID=1069815 RepID=A0ABD3UT32_SINWO
MASDKKASKKDKEIQIEFESHLKDIRQQLSEQLKCLENRLEIQTAMVSELQEFFRRKAEIEQEYSRNLERLVKNTWTKHKQERQKRENWDKFSTFYCLTQLLEVTKKQSHDHLIMGEICRLHVVNRLTEIMDNATRIFLRCRDIGAESHEEILKTLNELQKAMKTYQQYQVEAVTAEDALKKVQSQRGKVEQQLSGKTLTGSRKFKRIEKQEDEKKNKYQVSKFKALHARNEYLLNIEVTNAAINKYFSDDFSDLMDCMDFGYHNSIRGTIMIYQSAHCNLRNSHQYAFDQLNNLISKMDPLTDKQKFLELYNQAFMLPKKFEFQPCRKDEIRQISAQKGVQDHLVQSYQSIEKMLDKLKLDNDETWKSLETTEKSLSELVNRKDVDVTSLFTDDSPPPKSPLDTDRKKSTRLETESYYLNKFRQYTLSNNRIARLQAKYNTIQKAVGEDSLSSSGLRVRPPSLPPKPKKRRIGRNPVIGQPKLFGGNLEEYIEATGQEIPLIIKSCVRVINLYGMHHQGVFRISGSQVEINDMKNSFEKGDDPLTDEDASEKINSAAGVLKLFFRELQPPLFPLHLFDELINCSRLEEPQKIEKIKELLFTLPRAILVIMRYLFAFLSHLSEYSDENMMDPYNLAICFGPTLLPIPPDRDQVTFQGNVNEVIKSIITNQEDIFPNDGGEVYEKCIVDDSHDNMDGMEEEEEEEEEESSSIQSDDEDTEVYEATALYDFSGRTGRELTFKKGDNLILYTKASEDWWEGAFAGNEGLIPANYVSIKHTVDDKRSLPADDEKSSSMSSLSSSLKSSLDSSLKSSLDSSLKSSLNSSVEKSLSQPNISSKSSDLESVIESPCAHCNVSVSAEVKSSDVEGPAMSSTVDHPEIKRQFSTPESNTNRFNASEDLKSMDTVLAEILSDVSALEKQQKSDKRTSLPTQKHKPTAKDTPDLVLDLPEGSDSSSPHESSGPDSPTLSAAETFAKSNQGTLKKAETMPRSMAPDDMNSLGQKAHSMPRNVSAEKALLQGEMLIKGNQPLLSTFANVPKGPNMMLTSMHSRKFSLEELQLRINAVATGPQTTMTTPPPPIAEKPKVPLKVKPPVMKKPTRSPDVQRRHKSTDSNSQDQSGSPNT